MTETKLNYAEFKSRQEEERQVKSSRVRCWGVAIWHLLPLPFIPSIVYATKTGKWVPTAVATGVAAVGVPLAVVDFGLTCGLVAPATSAIMLINQVKEDRRRQQFIGPEEADVAYFSRF